MLLKKTPELSSWIKKDGEQMDQEAFAMFIENVALTLTRTTDANFRSSQRLENGQIQFRYEEYHDDTAGVDGELTIPSMLRIGLPLFTANNAEEGFLIDARFRYRIRQKKLVMWYELIRPERVIKHAVTQTLSQLQEAFKDDDSVAFYQGKPD